MPCHCKEPVCRAEERADVWEACQAAFVCVLNIVPQWRPGIHGDTTDPLPRPVAWALPVTQSRPYRDCPPTKTQEGTAKDWQQRQRLKSGGASRPGASSWNTA